MHRSPQELITSPCGFLRIKDAHLSFEVAGDALRREVVEV